MLITCPFFSLTFIVSGFPWSLLPVPGPRDGHSHQLLHVSHVDFLWSNNGHGVCIEEANARSQSTFQGKSSFAYSGGN
jgi:hypothetical protein